MAQRRKLARLQGLGWVTDAALAKILKRLSEEPLDEDQSVSRHAIRRDLSGFLSQPTTYGPPVQSMTLPTRSGEFSWQVCNPFAMLCFLASQSPASVTLFRRSVRTALRLRSDRGPSYFM